MHSIVGIISCLILLSPSFYKNPTAPLLSSWVEPLPTTSIVQLKPIAVIFYVCLGFWKILKHISSSNRLLEEFIESSPLKSHDNPLQLMGFEPLILSTANLTWPGVWLVKAFCCRVMEPLYNYLRVVGSFLRKISSF